MRRIFSFPSFPLLLPSSPSLELSWRHETRRKSEIKGCGERWGGEAGRQRSGVEGLVFYVILCYFMLFYGILWYFMAFIARTASPGCRCALPRAAERGRTAASLPRVDPTPALARRAQIPGGGAAQGAEAPRARSSRGGVACDARVIMFTDFFFFFESLFLKLLKKVNEGVGC